MTFNHRCTGMTSHWCEELMKKFNSDSSLFVFPFCIDNKSNLWDVACVSSQIYFCIHNLIIYKFSWWNLRNHIIFFIFYRWSHQTLLCLCSLFIINSLIYLIILYNKSRLNISIFNVCYHIQWIFYVWYVALYTYPLYLFIKLLINFIVF